MKPIPYGQQNITQGDIDAVVEALKSDYLTQGPKIKEFEDKFATYVNAKYAVAVSNGTAALHLSTLALNVEMGQKVITTPITFAASANCVRYCGGEVVFGDIDPNTYLLDINSVRNLLAASPKGTYSGIIPVDFAGRAINLEGYRKLAEEYGLWIIQDACHSPGGYFKTDSGSISTCGSGQFADLAIFSFHPVKHIAAGEGGMITTNNKNHYEKLLSLRSHGIVRNSNLYKNDVSVAYGTEATDSNYPFWYMEMQELGYNYRLTDIQAALGHSQLKRADEGLEKRRNIAASYQQAFENTPFILGQSGIVEGHAYHLYVIEVEDRKGLYQFLREHKVLTQVHYFPTHLMPYYKQFGWQIGDLPHAETFYSRCLSLPIYPTLSTEQQAYVINLISEYYNG